MGRRNKSRNGHITQYYHFTEPAAPPPMDGKTLKTPTMEEGRGERKLTRVMRSISKSRFTYAQYMAL
jgi:hypothetical protein